MKHHPLTILGETIAVLSLCAMIYAGQFFAHLMDSSALSLPAAQERAAGLEPSWTPPSTETPETET